MKSEMRKHQSSQQLRVKDEKDQSLKLADFETFSRTLHPYEKQSDFRYFCQNSIVLMEDDRQKTLFVPAYVRTHFRNMTEMDIQNLSCKFIATMNISFYLGTYSVENIKQKTIVQKFAGMLDKCLRENLKVTFQNDFVLDIKEDMSTNVSDSDRTIRASTNEYQFAGVRRIYTTFIITRQFKFGLRSDILFFPLQQNDLDLVTTLNPIKVNLEGEDKTKSKLTIKFNCMNIEMTSKKKIQDKNLLSSEVGNQRLLENLKDLYMHQYDGKQLNKYILQKQYQSNKNNPFFRSVKLSFPLKSNSTQFGYYSLVEKEIEIHYTREKQNKFQSTFYERIKNCLFCRKKIYNYKSYEENGHIGQGDYESIDTEDRSLEDSYCNSIIRIPMLKASLGTIIQLCIPIFFLSFLSLVEFLYSQSTSGDVVRGLKIGSSTLIVATYINFIYAMRSVIPPTPSWSIFEIAVSILAATSLLPIIESIYASNYQTYQNPFLTQNGLFIAAFIIQTILCVLIVIMLLGIKFYKDRKTKRAKLQNVKMDDLLSQLTKKYFFIWRNAHCYDYMRKIIANTRPVDPEQLTRIVVRHNVKSMSDLEQNIDHKTIEQKDIRSKLKSEENKRGRVIVKFQRWIN